MSGNCRDCRDCHQHGRMEHRHRAAGSSRAEYGIRLKAQIVFKWSLGRESNFAKEARVCAVNKLWPLVGQGLREGGVRGD